MKEKFAPAGANELENSEKPDGKVAGFWQGFWHGSTMPITFVVSLFKDNVGIYEPHNNGNWYNFGYLLGLMIVLGGNNGARKQINSDKG
jgi:hypothetical protein